MLLCQGVSMGWPYYVCPLLVGVSMEYMDTLPRGYPWVSHAMYVQHWSKYLWNPQTLCQTRYPWVGHTMYVQHWSEYSWNPRILCQGDSYPWVAHTMYVQCLLEY